MSRNKNIETGKNADIKILNCISKLDNVIGIIKVGDYQQEKWNRELKPTEQMQNSINQYLGVDYLIVMKGEGYNLGFIDGKLEGVTGRLIPIDTKGFNYNSEYYGKLENGIVETMLLQVKKYYSNRMCYGWANNPSYKTKFILILINNHIYFIDYKKLVEHCKKLNRRNCNYRVFEDKKGNYEECFMAPVKGMIENKVITCIIPTQ